MADSQKQTSNDRPWGDIRCGDVIFLTGPRGGKHKAIVATVGPLTTWVRLRPGGYLISLASLYDNGWSFDE